MAKRYEAYAYVDLSALRDVASGEADPCAAGTRRSLRSRETSAPGPGSPPALP